MKRQIRGHKWSKGRVAFPSIFFTFLSPSDTITLRRQAQAGRGGRRFSHSLVRGVSHRCEHGHPQVVFCGATRGAEPFPTSFWLVCPHLLRAAGRMEAENGVAGMERFLSDLPDGREQWRRYHALHATLRLSLLSEAKKEFLRARRRRLYRSLCKGGVGGISYGGGEIFVKCLHLQIASYLGMGRHPAARWLEENMESWECPAGLCATPDDVKPRA